MTNSEETNAVVLNYLRKMGYRQTEKLFKEEAHTNTNTTRMESMAFELRSEQDSSIANYLLFTTGNIDKLSIAYDLAFDNLRQWIDASLDAFRDEFIPILYPLLVHSFLDLLCKGMVVEGRIFLEKYKTEHLSSHEDELLKLSTITEAGQVRENPLATAFRSSKYNIAMSAYAFQLLMTFLQDGISESSQGNILILKIINQFINIRVIIKSTNNSHSTATIATGLTGSSGEVAVGINKGKISWGVNAVDPAIEAALHHRSKVEGRLNEILQGSLAQMKRMYIQSSLHAPPSSDQIPKQPVTASESNAEIDRLKSMARKANLSSTTLPTICCYTLHNTFESITSIDFSPTATMMATGNRDSYIDIWSLNHEPLKAIRPSTELAAMDLSNFDSLEPMREYEGSLSKRLIGHHGSIYGCKFMHPDGMRLLVSVSQDGTARLWSLDLFKCIVVYRGHNAPIWDLDVAPLGVGPYFVTASADKTARLWSTDQVQPLRIFAGHLSDVDCVKFHPNGNYIITGSTDKTCRMWDVQSGACVRLLSGHSRPITCLAISPDGRFLASSDRSSQLIFWDLSDGRLIRSLSLNTTTNSSSSYSLDFDRDGRILAVSGAEHCIYLLDVAKIISSNVVDDSTCILSKYPTKATPIFKLFFTYRNILLASGPFTPDNTATNVTSD